jgi:hypothetical protein
METLILFYSLLHEIKEDKIYELIVIDNILVNFKFYYSASKFSLYLCIGNIRPNAAFIIFKYIPLFLLVLFFILECSLNNFILHYIFYYLPIYMLFTIWIQISSFLEDILFNPYSSIIMKRTYGFPTIVYVNFGVEEEKILQMYLENPRHMNCNHDLYYIPGIYGIIFPYLEYFHEFKLIPGKEMYENINRERCFEAKNLLEIDGKYFVEDPDNPEAMEYYKKLKDEKEKKKIFK